jgi:LysR family glycine cleavage system transcriptional activator
MRRATPPILIVALAACHYARNMPARPPSLRAIAAFEAAARHQSFARAALELHLTSGAISHAIRGLEERLDVALFEREGRGVSLTEEGRVLAGRVRLGIGLLSSAFETKPWLERSKLIVSVLPAFASRFLIPRLGRFTARHPTIEIELRGTWALAEIGNREADIGLRYGPGGWAGLSAIQLAEETLFPVASANYKQELPCSPTELLAHELICHPEFQWRPWFAHVGLDVPEPKAALTVDDSILVLEAAAAGQGIALARSLLAMADLQLGRLVRVFDEAVPAHYSYWMVWNPVSPKLPNIELFRAWLQEELAEFQKGFLSN